MAKRLTADPCLGISDLQKPVLEFMKETGSYDLWKHLEPKDSQTWKTAPNIPWLMQIKPLMEKLLLKVPGCLFPASKLKKALEMIQKEVCRLNYSRKRDEEFFDKCSLWIRIAASQLRDLKKFPGEKQRALKKCSMQQHQKLEELLELVNLGADEQPVPGAQQPAPAPEVGLALVPVENKTNLLAVVPVEPVAKTFDHNKKDKIFRRILQKKDSLESEVPAAPVQPTASSSAGMGSRSQKHQVLMGFSKSESELLAEALKMDLKSPAKRKKKKGRAKKASSRPLFFYEYVIQIHIMSDWAYS